MKSNTSYTTIGPIRYTDSIRNQDFMLHDSTHIYVTDVTITGYNTRIEFRSEVDYTAVGGYFDVRNEFYDTLPDISHMLKERT